MAILNDMTAAQRQELELLRKQNEELKAKLEARNNRALTWKVSEKGAVSVYGLGRFPVTLYPGQWPKLAKVMPEILDFIEEQIAEGNVKASKYD